MLRVINGYETSLKVKGGFGSHNDTEIRVGKILIAEDNRKFRLAPEKFLTEAGYQSSCLCCYAR